MSSVRVLQIIADTDPGIANDAAIGLHALLVDQGLEMRTLALTPGSQPGHEQVVPTIAHSRRSMAARTGVANERKWADVVVLHGVDALVAATRPQRNSSVPTVFAASGAGDLDALVAGVRPAAGFSGRLARIVVGAAAEHSASLLDEPDRDVVARISDDDARAIEWAELLRSLVRDSA